MPSSSQSWLPGEITWVLILCFFLILSLLYNLGLNPLHFEEPRRALIGLEMQLNQNYWVPTQTGDFYYKKPPVYNWLLIFFTNMLGSQSEFAYRLVTPISLVLMSLLTFQAVKIHVGKREALYAALFTMVASHMYIHFSRLAEIDIFYSLITYAGFLSLYHFDAKQKAYTAFMITYILGAIGALTKGFPTLVFLGLSITAYLLLRGEWKRLFSGPHLAGVLVFFLLVGGYFAIYLRYNALENYFYYMWSQASERTVLENKLSKFFHHLYLFPVNLWLNLLPGSLLLIWGWHRGYMHTLRRHPFVAYCGLMILANIWVYWISPGTRPRYIYMFHPLLIILMVYGYFHRPTEERFWAKLGVILGGVLVFSLGIGAWTLPFIPNFEFIPRYEIYTISAITFAFALLLSWLYWQKKAYRFLCLVSALVLVRWVVNFTVIPDLAQEGLGKDMQDIAYAIYEEVGEAPLYLWEASEIHLTTVFYLERSRQKVLSRSASFQEGMYFLKDEEISLEEPFETLMEFISDGRTIYLIRKPD